MHASEANYYMRSMAVWRANPNDTCAEHLRKVGVDEARGLFGRVAPETCLVRELDAWGHTIGVQLKPGVTSEDLWGKAVLDAMVVNGVELLNGDGAISEASLRCTSCRVEYTYEFTRWFQRLDKAEELARAYERIYAARRRGY